MALSFMAILAISIESSDRTGPFGVALDRDRHYSACCYSWTGDLPLWLGAVFPCLVLPLLFLLFPASTAASTTADRRSLICSHEAVRFMTLNLFCRIHFERPFARSTSPRPPRVSQSFDISDTPSDCARMTLRTQPAGILLKANSTDALVPAIVFQAPMRSWEEQEKDPHRSHVHLQLPDGSRVFPLQSVAVSSLPDSIVTKTADATELNQVISFLLCGVSLRYGYGQVQQVAQSLTQ